MSIMTLTSVYNNMPHSLQHIIYTLLILQVATQHHNFNRHGRIFNMEGNEEVHSHTFYILHDKPYIMPRTNAEGMI